MTDPEEFFQASDGGRRAVTWRCDPPPRDALFVVTREGWSFAGGVQVQEIHKVEILDAEGAPS